MRSIELLSLDDPRWHELEASVGGTGELTVRLLRQVRTGDDTEDFTEEQAFLELYDQICHQNSVGEIAYAVVPHLVDIAADPSHLRRTDCLTYVASVLGSSLLGLEGLPPVPKDLQAGYELAKQEALRMATEELAQPIADPCDSLLLLQIVAAMHGHTTIAILIEAWPDYTCPLCESVISDVNDANYDPRSAVAESPSAIASEEPEKPTKKWWQWW